MRWLEILLCRWRGHAWQLGIPDTYWACTRCGHWQAVTAEERRQLEANKRGDWLT